MLHSIDSKIKLFYIVFFLFRSFKETYTRFDTNKESYGLSHITTSLTLFCRGCYQVKKRMF